MKIARTIIFFTFLILLILTSCGQEKIEVISETFPDGKPKTIRYFNSKEDSKENIIVTFKEGTGTVNLPLTFEEKNYHRNGKLKCRGFYINGQTSGLWEYFYETGIQEAKTYYDFGKSTDTVLCWYSSGNIKKTIFEIDTVKNYWHSIDFYESGAKQYECYYTKDRTDSAILNGDFKEWYENGQLKFFAKLENGWTVGKWIEYEELDGSVKEESNESFLITIK